MKRRTFLASAGLTGATNVVPRSLIGLDPPTGAEWTTTFGSRRAQDPAVLLVDGDRLLVGGETKPIGDDGEEESRLWFTALDRDGTVRFERTYDISRTATVSELWAGPDGGYRAVAFGYGEAEAPPVMVALDQSGQRQWTRPLHLPSFSDGVAVELFPQERVRTDDGGLVVAGRTDADLSVEEQGTEGGEKPDLVVDDGRDPTHWVAKYDSDGTREWVFTATAPGVRLRCANTSDAGVELVANQYGPNGGEWRRRVTIGEDGTLAQTTVHWPEENLVAIWATETGYLARDDHQVYRLGYDLRVDATIETGVLTRPGEVTGLTPSRDGGFLLTREREPNETPAIVERYDPSGERAWTHRFDSHPNLFLGSRSIVGWGDAYAVAGTVATDERGFSTVDIQGVTLVGPQPSTALSTIALVGITGVGGLIAARMRRRRRE